MHQQGDQLEFMAIIQIRCYDGLDSSGGSIGGRRLLNGWCQQNSRPLYPVTCWTLANSLVPQTHCVWNCSCSLPPKILIPPALWSLLIPFPSGQLPKPDTCVSSLIPPSEHLSYPIGYPVPSSLLSPFSSILLLPSFDPACLWSRLSYFLLPTWPQQTPRSTRWIFVGSRPHLFKTLLRLSAVYWIKSKKSGPKLSKNIYVYWESHMLPGSF